MRESRKTYYGVQDDQEQRDEMKAERVDVETRGKRSSAAIDCPGKALNGKHVLIVGKTGSGKTYWMAQVCNFLNTFIFVNTQLERVVEKITSFSTDNATEVVKALEEGHRKIEFIPSENDIEAIDQLEFIRRDLWAVAQEMKIGEGQWWVNFIVDEAQAFAWLGSRTDLQNLARRGRRFGVKAWFLSQQPQDLAKAIVNNIDWQILFKLGQYSSVYFKTYKIPIEEHLGWLERPYHYVLYDGSVIYRCNPIG